MAYVSWFVVPGLSVGNRVSRVKWYRNIFIVWLFTGFWHGASWNFVIWGLYFGVLLVIEKNWLLPVLKRAKVLNHIYVLLLLLISFVIFNAADPGMAWTDICNLFGFGNIPLYSTEAGYYMDSFSLLLLAAVIGCTPVMRKIGEWISKRFIKPALVGKIILLLLLLILSTSYLVDGSFNPFLYFRF